MTAMIKQMFQCPAAFSDHTPGWDMDVAAVALGVNLLEKTITEDRTTRSVEHIMSLEPQDMKQFINTIREVEIALGKPRRILSDEEQEKRRTWRRSIHLTRAVKAGDTLSEEIIEFRRPGFGIQPDRYEECLGKKFNRDIAAGEIVKLDDFFG